LWAFGQIKVALAAVEFTVTVAIPLVVVELNVTACIAEHMGRSVAPAGLAVMEHARETVPAYPFVELTVTVEVAEPPGATVIAVADIEYAVADTITEAVPDAAL
jgi:hypothetical protein